MLGIKRDLATTRKYYHEVVHRTSVKCRNSGSLLDSGRSPFWLLYCREVKHSLISTYLTARTSALLRFTTIPTLFLLCTTSNHQLWKMPAVMFISQKILTCGHLEFIFTLLVSFDFCWLYDWTLLTAHLYCILANVLNSTLIAAQKEWDYVSFLTKKCHTSIYVYHILYIIELHYAYSC